MAEKIELMESSFLTSAQKQFEFYKSLGEKAMSQVSDEELFIEPARDANSMAIIVKHLHGNMLSRWTDFLTTDGEKENRNRDSEFVNSFNTRAEVVEKWNEGWAVLFAALEPLTEIDLEQIVYIRNMGHTVTEAISRQLCHYAYHVGQMVYIGKIYSAENWKSLSIPKNKSAQYNSDKFSREKSVKHFTDDDPAMEK